MGILAALLSMFGCMDHGRDPDLTGRKNMFAELSPVEKENYIAEAMKNKYGFDCKISEVEKRKITSVRKEALYFTTAQVDNINGFHLWVDDDGNIQDTGFCLKIAGTVNHMLSEQSKGLWEVYYIHDFFRFEQPSAKQWSREDDLKSMFEREAISNRIYLFLDGANDRSADDSKFEKIKERLSYMEGILYVCYCDNPLEIDLAAYDLDTYEKCIYLK